MLIRKCRNKGAVGGNIKIRSDLDNLDYPERSCKRPQTINGIVRTGAVFLPIIFALTAPEIRYIIEHSESKYVITEKRLLPKIKEALAGRKTQPKLIVINAAEEDHCINYTDLLTESDSRGDVENVADDELAKYHTIYKNSRDLICRRLNKLKNIFEYQKPDSAYFVFPRIKEDILQKIVPNGGSKEFAIELLEKAKVATVPGSAFGPVGENHIRMCFGLSEEDINLAFDRLEEFFENFKV